MPDPEPAEFKLTAGEAADLLNVSARTLNRWADGGLVAYWRPNPTGTRRYRLQDILDLSAIVEPLVEDDEAC